MSQQPNTAIRLTDIQVETAHARLGNSGNAYLDDTLSRVIQGLGLPLEFLPTVPASVSLTYEAGVYVLPNGVRLAALEGVVLPNIAAGTINFQAGTISSGGRTTFTPVIPTGSNYVKARIEFDASSSSLNVKYGTPAASLAAANIPAGSADYVGLYIVELHSVGGVLQPITASNLIKVADAYAPDASEPKLEIFDTTVPISSHTLTAISVPLNRDRLQVFRNGQLLAETEDYTVDNDNVTVNFTYEIYPGSKLTFRVV